MKFSRTDADTFVPDGSPPAQALARTTHLAIGAHQDDIEIMAQAGIDACHRSGTHFFTGVVVTDGAGSSRQGPYAQFTDREMRTVRREEQRRAATVGAYGLQVQLAYASSEVTAPSPGLAADLARLFSGAVPQVAYVHNPADKHDSHVAVFLRCLEAWRALPVGARPRQVLGCEVWRSLDWLADADKVALEAGSRPALARGLLEVFASQIQGGKRYDLATLGRRAANATFADPRAGDGSTALVWAMDLTPLVHHDTRDVADFVHSHLDRLRADIDDRLQRLRGPA